MTQETILITGGTSVVGKAVIPDLIQKRYKVFFTSRNKDSQIEGAECIQADLLSTNGAADLTQYLNQNNISINHLINNFRDIENLKTNEGGEPTSEQWIREYQSSVIVPYEIAQQIAKVGTLKSIINITSIYGVSAANLNLYDGDQRSAPIHYNVSKAAEIHLTKEMAIRLAEKKIRVNAVAYGGIKGRANSGFENKYAALCPLEGMLDQEDLSGALLFLLSQESSAKLTGQTIQIDGGWTLW